MATLKRVGPGSAFKIAVIVYAFLGLVIGILFGFVSMLGVALHSGDTNPGLGMLGFGLGFGAVLVFPVLYGVVGGIFAAIGALLYNLVANWVGGLEVDIS
jgi:hypothetical protein